jgi:metal-dependent amidase/aminoacylase/carboxypeptidase family protein
MLLPILGVEKCSRCRRIDERRLELQKRAPFANTALALCGSKWGDQPNVVPSKASVWYYFRERTYPKIKELYDFGKKIAQGAAMMTDTKVSWEVLGSAWPVILTNLLPKEHSRISSE